jgi:MFS family permease
MPGAGSTLSPLSHRLFLLLLVTSIAGNIGNAIQAVGASWLMASMDGRADMVALVNAAISLPMMLLALVGGAVADTYDRRSVMRLAQAATALLSLLLAFLSWRNAIGPWGLVALTFALGAGFAFYTPAAQASIGTVVPRSELAGAASLNTLAFNVARTAGPALGGAIVATAGAFGAFLVNTGAALTAIAIMAFWRPPPNKPAEGATASVGSAMLEGLRRAYETPAIRTIVVRAFVFTLTGSAVWALMPLIARDLTGGGPRQFGYLLGALGCGAVAGAMASHSIRKRFRGEAIVRAAGVVFGLAAIVVSLQPGFLVTMIVLVIGGAFWVQALSGFGVGAQLWAPPRVVGRVISIVSTGTFGGLAVGSWAWGHVAQWAGLVPAIAASGVTMIVLGLIRFLPMPSHEGAQGS